MRGSPGRSRRAASSLVELQAVTVLLALLFVSLVPVATGLARGRQDLTAYADDLVGARRIADRIAREVRCATRVAAGTPDRVVRTGARALVLAGPDGALIAISLEPDGAERPPRAVLRRYEGRVLRARSDLGPAGRLSFRALPGDGPTAVWFDVELPARGVRPEGVSLSSAALLGGGELGS